MIDLRDYFIYDTVVDGRQRYYVSPLTNEVTFEFGLPSEAIMGELVDGPDQISAEHFEQNPLLVKFLAGVIATHGKNCPGLVAETERQQNGFVYILDERYSSPDGSVPPEDIVGGMEISNGTMLRFHSSPKYRILTKNGFMKIDSWLIKKLTEELIILAQAQDKSK